MAGNCAKLRFNRRRLGLTQKQFADLVGLHVLTIGKLERDETAWLTVKSETIDKIMAHYDSMASWQPDEEAVRREVLGLDPEPEIKEPIVKEVKIVEPEPEVVKEESVHIEENGLTDKDRQIMKYIEFACANLRESKTHEDFETNVKVLKRIIKNQY